MSVDRYPTPALHSLFGQLEGPGVDGSIINQDVDRLGDLLGLLDGLLEDQAGLRGQHLGQDRTSIARIRRTLTCSLSAASSLTILTLDLFNASIADRSSLR